MNLQIYNLHRNLIRENVEMYKSLQESIRLCGEDFLQAVYFEMITKFGDRFHT